MSALSPASLIQGDTAIRGSKIGLSAMDTPSGFHCVHGSCVELTVCCCSCTAPSLSDCLTDTPCGFAAVGSKLMHGVCVAVLAAYQML